MLSSALTPSSLAAGLAHGYGVPGGSTALAAQAVQVLCPRLLHTLSALTGPALATGADSALVPPAQQRQPARHRQLSRDLGLLPWWASSPLAAPVRFHGNHGHAHSHGDGGSSAGAGQVHLDRFKNILSDAPEKFQGEAKKRLRDFARLPWEVSMSKEDAAKALGSFLGIANLEPATVLHLDRDQVHAILDATTNKGNTALEKALFSYADAVTTRFFGEEVYYRGIVEFSNVCQNDCGYCGIRKHMQGVHRYTMPIDEVVDVARWAFDNRLGNLMLQAGELRTDQRNAYIEEVVRRVRATTIALDLERQGKDPTAPPADTTDLGIAVSLSVGELPTAEYERFFKAGARRYLLRIETSSPELYETLHPADMSWQHRVDCLKELKRVGYMIGTGVMVGLPGQTLRDLAGDIVFFREIGANMIGMGPYITEAGTPVADMWERQWGSVDKKAHMKKMFDLTTRMNSLARVTLGNANISATTALQAIDPMGREIALRRGSNVLMPILTPTKYREHYQLYEGKPCITDTADECRKCLNARISMIGKRVKDSVWGDPPNFTNPASGITVPHHQGEPQQQAAAAGGRAYSSLAGTAGDAAGRRSYSSYSTAAVLGTDAPSAGGKPSAAGNGPVASGPAAGSDTPRVNIGIFGIMNAGKSTLMNRITRQETSIVDSKPGTTADVKTTLMELHDIGPAKLFDTAGIDEQGELGEKKRRRTLSTLKESDLAVVVVDVPRVIKALSTAGAGSGVEAVARDLHWEKELLDQARWHDVVPAILFNLKGVPTAERAVAHARAFLDPSLTALSLTLDLNATTKDVPTAVAQFLQEGVARLKKEHLQMRSLPDEVLRPDAMVFLNIPMDAETPTMRLLRPQALVQEEAIRHWATTVGYRMDLGKARSKDPALVAEERARFMTALAPVIAHKGPKLMVTDSQAVDIVHPWTLDADGKPLVPFTTFSIAMIHRQSGGRLELFAQGLHALKELKPGSHVLISEACNHNRITDVCNDIGMVQIPQHLKRIVGGGLEIEHAFGREFPELDNAKLPKYDLAIHCGGCMIDQQKMRARAMDLQDAGVPVTNYGLFLSYVTSPDAVKRAMAPWGLEHAV